MTERKSREIRIVIADDHPIFREGLAKVISRDVRLQIVAQAENGDEALAQLTKLRPDVAVLDLDMPERDGFSVTRAAQDAQLGIKVIILTSHNNEALFQSAIDLGVAGYVLKDGAINEIVNAIRVVAGGGHYFSPELSTYLLNRANRPSNPNERKRTDGKESSDELLQITPSKFEPGSNRISRYRILRQLGVGGMGKVYLAEDLNLGRQLAIKVLTGELTRDSAHLRRFEREARAASALNHPNILTVYEIGESDGTNFIATEFVEGESLGQRIKHGPMKMTDILDIGIQVASALAAAHEARIVHRDIKPDNVMIRTDHLVKVLDFGLAKPVSSDANQVDYEGVTQALLKTMPGMVLGTAEYMSPEQARGHEVDERTDIWSLGVVLYRMVTGKTPFNGETISDVIASILKTEPSPPLREGEPVPRELQQIISKCLRKDREDRYQHIKDLLIDMKDYKREWEFSSRVGPSEGQITRPSTSNSNSDINSSFVAQDEDTTPTESTINKLKRHKLRAVIGLVVLIALVTIGYFAC